MSPARTCRSCLRLATKGVWCEDCSPPPESDLRRERKRSQYGPEFQRKANWLRKRARRDWRTSRCGICGRRLFDDQGQLIGRQLHVHHVWRGSDETLEVAHSACNEAEGEPPAIAEALADALTGAELAEQVKRMTEDE